jgi:hypothetical protein
MITQTNRDYIAETTAKQIAVCDQPLLLDQMFFKLYK